MQAQVEFGIALEPAPMKCFYDQKEDAVGTCKSCGKGLSLEYAVDLGKGLACKGNCEEDVRKLIELLDENVAARQASVRFISGSAGGNYAHAVFMLVLGAVFLLTGLAYEGLYFARTVGAVLLAYGVYQFLRARKMSALAEEFARPEADRDRANLG